MQVKALNVSKNVANFASELEPDLLAVASLKMLSASAKFMAGVSGEKVRQS